MEDSTRKEAFKKIVITKGSEYKIKSTTHEEDLFSSQYRRALDLVKEIVVSSPTPDGKKNRKSDEYSNNIIVFDGDRGQGKSSAMRSFINILSVCNDPEKQTKEFDKIGYPSPDDHPSADCFYKKTVFSILPTIDPSNFETYNSILDTIVANMFRKINDKWGKNSNDNHSDYRDIMACFNNVYESLEIINKREASDNLDYSTGIEKIARVNQSNSLSSELLLLTTKYLSLITKNEKNSILVIPVDDLDTYIGGAHKLIDEIRKYLVLPNILVVLAANIEQLALGVSLHFSEELGRKSGSRINRSSTEKAMAKKYLDKVMPSSRRITLPSLTEIDKSFSVIEYWGGDNKNLLTDIYDSFRIDSSDPSASSVPPSLLIIRLLYEKTGLLLHYVAEQVHSILPRNLRGLIDLVTLLVSLKTPSKTPSDGNPVYLSNLQRFREYFVYEWIDGNADDNTRSLGTEMSDASLQNISKLTAFNLMELLENRQAYSLYPVKQTDKGESSPAAVLLKEELSRTKLGISSNIMLLNALIFSFVHSNIENTTFVVKTLLSILLQETYRMSLLSPNKNPESRSNLFRLYEGKLFGDSVTWENGKYKTTADTNSFIRAVTSSKQFRVTFAVDYDSLNEELIERYRSIKAGEPASEPSYPETSKLLTRFSEEMGLTDSLPSFLSLMTRSSGANHESIIIGGNGKNTLETYMLVSVEAFLLNLLDIIGNKSRFLNEGSKVYAKQMNVLDTIEEGIAKDLNNFFGTDNNYSVLTNVELIIALNDYLKETADTWYVKEGVEDDTKRYYHHFFDRLRAFARLAINPYDRLEGIPKERTRYKSEIEQTASNQSVNYVYLW